MKKIISVTFIALIIAGLVAYICFPHLWPQYSDLWPNLASSLFGSAITIPIIYLIIEKAIDIDRMSRWLPARKSLFTSIYRQTQGVLSLFAFLYGNVPALELFNDRDAAVQEAKRVSEEVLAKTDWSICPGRLDNLVTSLETQISSLLATVRSNQNILSNDPTLFEQAFEVENRMNDLSAIASFKSFPKGILEISSQQQEKITECMRKLISALLKLLDMAK
jgi:hypothetical protein